MALFPSGKERRRAERRDIEVDATLTYEGFPPLKVRTRDLSATGVFLHCGSQSSPALGTEVYVEITPFDDQVEPMIVQAKVVRVTAEGIALAFME
ncbi:MAG: PilZ domain-containing protein [Acidiferrobacteraceae bacterium]|jgi:c-di-GMP-binding flagellar brake protein YcgR